MGAIDHDAQASQRHRPRQRALGELDVAVVHAVDALGAPEAVRLGQSDADVLIEHLLDAGLDLVGQLVAVGAEQLDAIVMVGIVRRRDHDADVSAQRAGEHGHRRRRDRAEQEHVHAGGAEARHHRVLDHVPGQAGVLAEHDAVAVVAALEAEAGGHADLHRHLGRHRKLVGLAPDPVSAEIASSHALPSPRAQSSGSNGLPQDRAQLASQCVSMRYESLDFPCCRVQFGNGGDVAGAGDGQRKRPRSKSAASISPALSQISCWAEAPCRLRAPRRPSCGACRPTRRLWAQPSRAREGCRHPCRATASGRRSAA